MTTPAVSWDIGSAYDLFISLHVLHAPDRWEVRGSWAAGVRSRLAAEQRDFLQSIADFLWAPLGWLYGLPAPKDGLTMLSALQQIPATARLATLSAFSAESPAREMGYIFNNIAERGNWTPDDLQALRRLTDTAKHPNPRWLETAVAWWARRDEFGERLLPALQAYYDVFFAEEEQRIQPALQAALTRAQSLAPRLALSALLEELSQGVSYTAFPGVTEVVLAPSFWATPLIIFGDLTPERHMILFGARPIDMSLVPGDPVPETLFRQLKALADPTRLRILRYLSAEPHTPAELARKLRLRPPTVTHHLHLLRLAQLVRLTFSEDAPNPSYTTRPEALQAISQHLDAFLVANDKSGAGPIS